LLIFPIDGSFQADCFDVEFTGRGVYTASRETGPSSAIIPRVISPPFPLRMTTSSTVS
jgi:hypothetical protein